MTAKQIEKDVIGKSKLKEFKALGFIVLVLFPVLSIFTVGSYGLIIWLIQALGGVIAH